MTLLHPRRSSQADLPRAIAHASLSSLEHRSSIFLWSDSMGDHRLLSKQQGGFSMRPPLWHPPVQLSTAEHAIIRRIRRAKLFVFLRPHRHTLFTETFQQDLRSEERRVGKGCKSRVV